MSNLKQVSEGFFEIEKHGCMHVPGLVVATNQLLEDVDISKALAQVENVACLPGIVGHSIAMPDIHWGYGFPIGGVAGMDVESGVVSPGGVGYDINCGVRLAIAPIKLDELDREKRHQLLHDIFRSVPSGIGRGQTRKPPLTDADYKDLTTKGAKWSIEQGYGFEKDLEHIESYGALANADISYISDHAKKRGATQLGSIGSGNHFVELGQVDEIFLSDIATAWGVEKGLTYILIHSGSRGFGHQVCQDTLNEMMAKGLQKNLPDPQLVCASLNSDIGQKYLSAMACAANFAFNNRQQILDSIRRCFHFTFGMNKEDVFLVYDVCHNIAKFEEHEVQGQKKKVCVHRKGATRAFGPNHPELAPIFQKTGQPVIVPGDMQRASYLLVGQGNPQTFASACHGAGRAKSRHQSMQMFAGKDLVKYMQAQGVDVMASSKRTIAEEMPDAYKDVDLVVEATEKANLAKIVAKLKPSLVIKG